MEGGGRRRHAAVPIVLSRGYLAAPSAVEGRRRPSHGMAFLGVASAHVAGGGDQEGEACGEGKASLNGRMPWVPRGMAWRAAIPTTPKRCVRRRQLNRETSKVSYNDL